MLHCVSGKRCAARKFVVLQRMQQPNPQLREEVHLIKGMYPVQSGRAEQDAREYERNDQALA